MRLSIVAAFSVCALSASVFAQAPSPAPPPAAAVPPTQAPLRMAFLDLQRIAAESSEGKVASSQVQALTQKKTAELAEKTKALKANQEKLQQGGSVLNDAARAQTEREIQRLTTEIDRFQEDANAEVQELQQSLQKEFEGKLRPIVDGLVKELAIGLLFSASDAGAIYVDPSLDITGEVIKRFDAAKGTAAKPAAPAATKPAAPATAKPAAPATAKPAAPPAAPPAVPPATQKPAAPAPAPAK
jgi:Skp family chaperone for outer membrane proteins